VGRHEKGTGASDLQEGTRMMVGKNSALFLCLLPVCFVLCSTFRTHADERQAITVSAAISLKNAFEAIGREFQTQYPGTVLHFNFGASGDLMMQIEAGAPVDVFASASLQEMEELKGKRLLLNDSFSTFAANKMVLIAPLKAPAVLNSFNGLNTQRVKRIAMANPKTSPAGRYAQEVLAYFHLGELIKEKLIFAGNVRQVLDYVARNEVDAGIVFSSDALALADKVRTAATAPAGSHKPVVYPIALLKQAQNKSPAEAFILFVSSDTGQMILKTHGFNPAA
jgi:molybdate transport system substrate-binding protein